MVDKQVINRENLAQNETESLISVYKKLLREYISLRPSGMRKRIAAAIGTNRSFVSQITNPAYSVPLPSHYVHKVIEVCHFTPIEKSTFLTAYTLAHPGQARLLEVKHSDIGGSITIDLSSVIDLNKRALIEHALRSVAEAMIGVEQNQSNPHSNGGKNEKNSQ